MKDWYPLTSKPWKLGTHRQAATAFCCAFTLVQLYLYRHLCCVDGVDIMEKCKVLIIGSGASGLYAAYCLESRKLTSDIIRHKISKSLQNTMTNIGGSQLVIVYVITIYNRQKDQIRICSKNISFILLLWYIPDNHNTFS